MMKITRALDTIFRRADSDYVYWSGQSDDSYATAVDTSEPVERYTPEEHIKLIGAGFRPNYKLKRYFHDDTHGGGLDGGCVIHKVSDNAYFHASGGQKTRYWNFNDMINNCEGSIRA